MTTNKMVFNLKFAKINLINNSYDIGYKKVPDIITTTTTKTTNYNEVEWIDNMAISFFKSIELIMDDTMIPLNGMTLRERKDGMPAKVCMARMPEGTGLTKYSAKSTLAKNRKHPLLWLNFLRFKSVSLTTMRVNEKLMAQDKFRNRLRVMFAKWKKTSKICPECSRIIFESILNKL